MATPFTTHLAQVRRELEETTASQYSDDSILAWTNDAANDIALKTKRLLDEQYTNTVVGQQSYELPVYTVEPEIVFYDGIRLTRESISDWWSADITASGTPTHFAATDAALYLRPIPTAVEQMRYFRRYMPTPFLTATATASMPFADRYNPLIRCYVKARAIEQVGDPTEASYYSNRYDTDLAEAVWEQKRSDGADTSASPQEVW